MSQWRNGTVGQWRSGRVGEKREEAVLTTQNCGLTSPHHEPNWIRTRPGTTTIHPPITHSCKQSSQPSPWSCGLGSHDTSLSPLATRHTRGGMPRGCLLDLPSATPISAIPSAGLLFFLPSDFRAPSSEMQPFKSSLLSRPFPSSFSLLLLTHSHHRLLFPSQVSPFSPPS